MPGWHEGASWANISAVDTQQQNDSLLQLVRGASCNETVLVGF